MDPQFPGVIELNVGGTHKFVTLLSTLTKVEGSVLARMFTGDLPVHTDKEGCYFLDGNGSTFHAILDYLKYDTLPYIDQSLSNNGRNFDNTVVTEQRSGRGLAIPVTELYNTGDIWKIYRDSRKFGLTVLAKHLEQNSIVVFRYKLVEYRDSKHGYEDCLIKILSVMKPDHVLIKGHVSIRLTGVGSKQTGTVCCAHRCQQSPCQGGNFPSANMEIDETVDVPFDVDSTLVATVCFDLRQRGFKVHGRQTHCNFNCTKIQNDGGCVLEEQNSCCKQKLFLLNFVLKEHSQQETSTLKQENSLDRTVCDLTSQRDHRLRTYLHTSVAQDQSVQNPIFGMPQAQPLAGRTYNVTQSQQISRLTFSETQNQQQNTSLGFAVAPTQQPVVRHIAPHIQGQRPNIATVPYNQQGTRVNSATLNINTGLGVNLDAGQNIPQGRVLDIGSVASNQHVSRINASATQGIHQPMINPGIVPNTHKAHNVNVDTVRDKPNLSANENQYQTSGNIFGEISQQRSDFGDVRYYSNVKHSSIPRQPDVLGSGTASLPNLQRQLLASSQTLQRPSHGIGHQTRTMSVFPQAMWQDNLQRHGFGDFIASSALPGQHSTSVQSSVYNPANAVTVAMPLSSITGPPSFDLGNPEYLRLKNADYGNSANSLSYYGPLTLPSSGPGVNACASLSQYDLVPQPVWTSGRARGSSQSLELSDSAPTVLPVAISVCTIPTSETKGDTNCETAPTSQVMFPVTPGHCTLSTISQNVLPTTCDGTLTMPDRSSPSASFQDIPSENSTSKVQASSLNEVTEMDALSKTGGNGGTS